MFPLIALAALASAFGAYQYGKRKGESKVVYKENQDTKQTSENNSTAKNVNTYNYYTNESENGNTLFGSQKKTKRTLFGNDNA